MKIPESALNRLLTRALSEEPHFRSVRSEVVLGVGMRADIIAEQHNGALALFELKARPLKQQDVAQIMRYTRCLEEQGHIVYAHLVGDGWPLIEHPPYVVLMDWSEYWGRLA